MGAKQAVERCTALLALFAIAAFLAACGGGNSTASTSGPPATTQASEGEAGVTSTSTAGRSTGESSPRHRPKSEAAERAAYEKARYGSSSPQSAPFAKYSGKGKAKLHLAEFGEEASGGERAAAQAVLAAYLQASGEGDWGRACSYLSATPRAEIDQLSKASGDSCGETLHKLAGASEESTRLTSEGVASLRIEQGGRAGEGAGFALFHGSDGADHWMAMKIEDRTWKVLSTAPQPFR